MRGKVIALSAIAGLFVDTAAFGGTPHPDTNRVDLFVETAFPVVDPGQTGKVQARVGNRGPDASRGIEIVVVTPYFVNFVRPLPKQCKPRYENPDPLVPEIMICELPGPIAAGEKAALDFEVKLEPGGPRGRNHGSVFVRPSASSGDVDVSLADNVGFAHVQRVPDISEQPEPGPRTGIYFTANTPPLGPRSDTSVTFVVGNAGPATTTKPIRMVYRTPFYVNLGDTLPAGCVKLLTAPDPAIPELAECTVPAGLEAGQQRAVILPIVAAGSELSGLLAGYALAVGADVDPWRVDNVHPVTANRLNGPLASLYSPDTPGFGPTGAGLRLTGNTPPPPDQHVNLVVVGSYGAATAGDVASSTFRVTNRGNETTKAAARLVISPPLFLNANRQRLPAGCTVVVSNPELLLPEFVECAVPAGLAPGQEHVVTLAMDALGGGPIGMMVGTVYVGVAAPDVEGFPIDNNAQFVIMRSPEPVAAKAPLGVDLWVTADQAALAVGQPGTVTIRRGNIGSLPTTKPVKLAYTTPFYVNIDRDRPLPAGCDIQADHPDPLISEIVICDLPEVQWPGTERTLQIPVRMELGGPAGFMEGRVGIAAQGDTELDPTSNVSNAAVIAVQE